MMSAVRHFALGVEMTLLKRHLAVLTVAVGVLKGPAYSSKFPPTVNRVQNVSALSGLISHTILPYVHYILSNGT